MPYTHSSGVTTYILKPDTTKPGRLLSTTKIGDVFMTRLVIEPGVTTGNYYHTETSVMFFVEKGDILLVCEHIYTQQKEVLHMTSGTQAIRIPTHVAHATKNMGDTDAVLIFFTNKRLRSGDDYTYSVLSE